MTDSQQFNFISRACLVCSAFEASTDPALISSPPTGLNVDYKSALAISKHVFDSGEDIISKFAAAELWEEHNISIKSVKNSKSRLDGPLCYLPDFELNCNGLTLEGRASTAVCMGDSQSKIFVRLRASNLPNSAVASEISKITEQAIRKIIESAFLPSYIDILTEQLGPKYGGSSNIAVRPTAYFPVETTDDVPEDLSPLFTQIQEGVIKDLLSAFEKDIRLLKAACKYILRPLGLLGENESGDYTIGDYEALKEKMAACRWEFQRVGSGEQSLFLRKIFERSGTVPTTRYAGITICKRPQSVEISSNTILNSLVAGL